jgi:hypothetical protein
MAQTQTSPWAGVPYLPEVTQAEVAPAPSVWAQPSPQPGDGQIPQVAMPQAPKMDLHANLPPVFAPVPKPNPQDEIAGHLQGRLQEDYKKDADPWGSPDNHPGFFGKLAHGLNHAFGGDTRRGWEEQGIAKQLNDVIGDESTNNFRNAETGKTTEETAEMPTKAKSEQDLQGAQEANLTSETNAREHPKESWKAIPGAVGPNGEPIEIEATSGNVRYGGVTGAQPLKQPKPNTPEQQYIDEYQTSHKGSTVAQAERAYTLDTQRPPQIAPIMMMVPNANGDGGSTATVVRPGSQVAPGAQTASGLNSANTPTAQMRNTAQRAELVHAMTPELLQNIDANSGQLGPVMGHWNEFMQGKVGLDNPNFAQLRADLLLYSSSVALAHAQGRLPENLREEFDRMINSPKQTPENLKAVIGRIDSAMQLNAQVMGGHRGATQPQPSAGTPPPNAKIIKWGDVKDK